MYYNNTSKFRLTDSVYWEKTAL